MMNVLLLWTTLWIQASHRTTQQEHTTYADHSVPIDVVWQQRKFAQNFLFCFPNYRVQFC